MQYLRSEGLESLSIRFACQDGDDEFSFELKIEVLNLFVGITEEQSEEEEFSEVEVSEIEMEQEEDESESELPEPEPIEILDPQAILESFDGDLEKASEAAFEDRPRVYSEFETALIDRMQVQREEI